MARKALGPHTLAVVQALRALPTESWVVACSGGADSLALAWAAHHVGGARAVVVDHGLQPGSDAVAHAVVERLAGFGMPAEAVRVRVEASGQGIEAAARGARYAALEAAVRPGERVLLGHTLDDQAETVILALARGSGIRSLSGMRAERGVFRRPLLGLGREVTLGACDELGLEPWHDPMNDDPAFARVRVRQVVLPTLERELGPGIREALARTASVTAATHDLVSELAEETTPELAGDCLHLLGLAPGLRRRVLHDWLSATGATDVSHAHVQAVEALVTGWRGQKGIDVPGGRVRRIDGRLHFRAHGAPEPDGQCAPR